MGFFDLFDNEKNPVIRYCRRKEREERLLAEAEHRKTQIQAIKGFFKDLKRIRDALVIITCLVFIWAIIDHLVVDKTTYKGLIFYHNRLTGSTTVCTPTGCVKRD